MKMTILVLLTILLSDLVFSQRSEVPFEFSGYDDPAISAAIGLLRSQTVKDHACQMKLVESLQSFLADIPKCKNAEVIRTEALEQLRSRDPERREKAGIVLARFRTLPADAKQFFSKSGDLRLASFARWHGSGFPTNTNVVSNPKLFSQGRHDGVDPVVSCRAALVEKLKIPEKRLAVMKKEFVVGYRKTFESNLKRLGSFIRENDRYWVDFDGDGIDELLAFGNVPDGWQGQRFTAIFKRRCAKKIWRLVHLRKWETCEHTWSEESPFIISDFDGDGHAEVVETFSIVGGWCWAAALYYDEANLTAPLSLISRGLEVVKSPIGKTPVIVTNACLNPTGGGKAAFLTTALGTQLTVYAFGKNAKVKIATLITRGNGW